MLYPNRLFFMPEIWSKIGISVVVYSKRTDIYITANRYMESDTGRCRGTKGAAPVSVSSDSGCIG